MSVRCFPFNVNAICDCCGMVGAYDFMGDLLCEKCATGNDQEDVMGHDSDCAVHSEPAYPAGECSCGACEKLAAAQRELAACRKAFAIYAWRQPNANISLKEAEILVGRRVAELLAQEGGK